MKVKQCPYSHGQDCMYYQPARREKLDCLSGYTVRYSAKCKYIDRSIEHIKAKWNVCMGEIKPYVKEEKQREGE